MILTECPPSKKSQKIKWPKDYLIRYFTADEVKEYYKTRSPRLGRDLIKLEMPRVDVDPDLIEDREYPADEDGPALRFSAVFYQIRVTVQHEEFVFRLVVAQKDKDDHLVAEWSTRYAELENFSLEDL